jgi:hypothetical protein
MSNRGSRVRRKGCPRKNEEFEDALARVATDVGIGMLLRPMAVQVSHTAERDDGGLMGERGAAFSSVANVVVAKEGDGGAQYIIHTMKIARKAQTYRRRQTTDCSDSLVDRERNTNGSQLAMSWATMAGDEANMTSTTIPLMQNSEWNP